ncbi:MAG: hemerythrin domain-containing protein [Betaproteobacteria bacterium]|nr:hemerythrin domain-containing protein [Betaproteobacteria bacterium]
MNTISQFLTADHRRCDHFFAGAEVSAKPDWVLIQENFSQFHSALTRHFSMEEKVLFPAFEQFTGNMMGPTRMMRMEHEQMLGLCARMVAAMRAQDETEYSGVAETLLILLQQHNIKEEQVLYPMSDQMLSGQVTELIGYMQTASSAQS